MKGASNPQFSHRVVWENVDDPYLVSLECACGRRFFSSKAYDDLDAHIASKQPT